MSDTTLMKTDLLPEGLSDHEKKRLLELYEYDILDTDPDENYTSLAELAARIYDMPVAQINFIDKDRQWSKVSLGVEMENLPLEMSFCNRTIQQDQFLLAPNATEDDRINDIPFVKDDPNVRFYAGVAIKGEKGYNIGTMCIVDLKPRDISEEDLETLRILASEVEARLNLHRRNRELKESNEKLSETATFLNNSTDLMFRIDPKIYKIIDINPEVREVLGYDRDEIAGVPLSKLAPGNQFLEQLNSWACMDYKGIFRFENCLKKKDGEKVWFQVQISEKNGMWYATARNINEKKVIEELHNDTLNILKNAQRIASVGHWEWLPKENKLIWSDELHQILGTDPDNFEVTIDSFLELVYPDDRYILDQAMQRIIGGGDVEPYEHRCVLPDGSIKHVMERGEVTRNENGEPVRVSGILQDVTASKEAETKLMENLKEKELMLSEIHHRVKNVIAMISGMLQLEQFKSNDVETSILDSIISRVQSMALVHENLYQCDSFSYVPIGELLKELVEIAMNSEYHKEVPNIIVETSPVSININQAIPFALTVNHLIFNSLSNSRASSVISISESGESVQLQVKSQGNSSLKSLRQNGNDEDMTTRIFQSMIQQLKAEYRVDSTGTDDILEIRFDKSDNFGSSAANFFHN